MKDFSVLIGGKAGLGIDKSGTILGRILNRAGYRVYIYRDYPSLIRGGHTFSIIRASKDRISVHKDAVDLVVALNQETLTLHKHRLKKECVFIFDSEQPGMPAASACGLGISAGRILKEENAPDIMRNTCVLGAASRAMGVGFETLEAVLRAEFAKDAELNVKVARRGFDAARQILELEFPKQEGLPLISGNEAVALGLVKGGLEAYIAYPMTPSSPILHYLAGKADDFSLDVLHPESEIAVILMALGFSYVGKRAAVGTSGGGFCLMTEGLSFAGMAELPIVIVLGQRPGPSTGLPTYSSQADLHFALRAGQGEFPRLIVAPGDAEEAYYWSALAMHMSQKFQIPAIVLSDKNMGEGVFNFDMNEIREIKEEAPPLRHVPDKDAVIKVNSYEHDESGITTEDPLNTVSMQDKRLRKEKFLAQELEGFNTVNVLADKGADTALLCWGSNKGVCAEIAASMGLRVIQPVVLHPFPVRQFQEALKGVKRLICVENNATGQLSSLLKLYGFAVCDSVLKYDGRPFSVEELERRLNASC